MTHGKIILVMMLVLLGLLPNEEFYLTASDSISYKNLLWLNGNSSRSYWYMLAVLV